jgi:hypothetical protein
MCTVHTYRCHKCGRIVGRDNVYCGYNLSRKSVCPDREAMRLQGFMVIIIPVGECDECKRERIRLSMRATEWSRKGTEVAFEARD